MLLELARSRAVLSALAVSAVLAFAALKIFMPPAPGSAEAFSQNPEAVERMREALAADRRLLVEREREQARLRQRVVELRKLLQQGQASAGEVQEAERLFVTALKGVYEMRHAVIETDIAITEAVLGAKVDRLPQLPLNGFSQNHEMARFNGGFKWSLKEAPRLEKFFSDRFGRRLPVTALGQSETHNRLRFDHRDSMDVALHPDSPEGKALIDHLRKNGIPFIAFRGAAPGVSTGPHIHIGRPSGRLPS